MALLKQLTASEVSLPSDASATVDDLRSSFLVNPIHYFGEKPHVEDHRQMFIKVIKSQT